MCIYTDRTTAFCAIPNMPYVAFRTTQGLLTGCFVGFKPTVTLLVLTENWGAVEEDMIRSNRKGNMDIYLPCSHIYYNNNYD